MRPVVLIIRDGWGLSAEVEGNAILAADTPNADRYRREYPGTVLECAGEAVGLPAGFMGSSEAGHLNMGAGRIVVQELKRVNDMMDDGTLWEQPAFERVVDHCLEHPGTTLHFMGLLQNEGVHAHEEHLYRMLQHVSAAGVQHVCVHVFTDGRDTPPRSTMEFIPKLEQALDTLGPSAHIGTVMGRYYGMDRARNWELVNTAYRCLVHAEGIHADSAAEAVVRSYREDRTPTGTEMFDEYIRPHVIGPFRGIKPGDGVIHYNYRQDRAIELTQAFVEDECPGREGAKPDVVYAALTRYYDEFPHAIIASLDSDAAMDNLLGEVLGARGLKQLRIAETQKFRHVTSFFNGKRTTPYPLEDQVEIPSQYDPATFAEHPEMNAHDVRDELLRRMQPEAYAFYAVNFANCDMVGHTGDFAAATRAVAITDDCVGAVVERALELDAHVLLTADHGNAEQMQEPDGGVRTAHSDCFPVECVYIANDVGGRTLIDHGKLSDLAPTILTLLDVDIPPDMTANVLFAK